MLFYHEVQVKAAPNGLRSFRPKVVSPDASSPELKVDSPERKVDSPELTEHCQKKQNYHHNKTELHLYVSLKLSLAPIV